jgi:methylase of polypeptide subunit release factors
MLMPLRRAIKPYLQPWQTEDYRGIGVVYKRCLDGGGRTFGQEYISFLRAHGAPRHERVFEWCAGPAFIGFSLLANDLCKTLCLADINPWAVEACRRTIRANRLDDRVTVYHSNNLNSIPESEKWDLVVGNPPHFVDERFGKLRAHDPDWSIHRAFYEQLPPHLAPNGFALIQENNSGSTPQDFRSMIERTGLDLVYLSDHQPARAPGNKMYFMGSVRVGDRRPSWLPA